ncbi:MAG TPA: DUF924 family protein [Caulobacteraceae bacterium]|jgi:uncharacterized protein (DUF924 family)|nr:DUF924 family protein [Caulobacteraceae bacterium]
MAATPADVTGFWTAAGPAKWWTRSDAFDDAIRLRFEPVHHAAARGEYAAWEATADGALALILLFDQFPRNLYRNSAHAFATDPLARAVARRAVETSKDRATAAELRTFIYMPFMHSEDLADQDMAVALFEAYDAETGELSNLKYAVEHREIIRRFGRFPHRNPMFGRAATPEERAFLDAGGFAG